MKMSSSSSFEKARVTHHKIILKSSLKSVRKIGNTSNKSGDFKRRCNIFDKCNDYDSSAIDLLRMRIIWQASPNLGSPLIVGTYNVLSCYRPIINSILEF